MDAVKVIEEIERQVGLYFQGPERAWDMFRFQARLSPETYDALWPSVWIADKDSIEEGARKQAAGVIGTRWRDVEVVRVEGQKVQVIVVALLDKLPSPPLVE